MGLFEILSRGRCGTGLRLATFVFQRDLSQPFPIVPGLGIVTPGPRIRTPKSEPRALKATGRGIM